MAVKFGKDGKFYIDTAGYTTPTWSEVTLATDVTLNGDPVEIDVSSRGSVASGFKATAVVVNDVSVDFTLIVDETDPNIQLIQNAFMTRGLLYIAALSGTVSVVGSWGLEAMVCVTKFTNGQPLLDKQTYECTVKPSLCSTPLPQWVTY